MDVEDLDADPVHQFRRWFSDVSDHAVALATADARGRPSVRMVLHKGVDADGFVFFTNYRSRKAAELAVNPQAALVYHWPPGRQVRVEGSVVQVSHDESDAYWVTRPRGSQLGAWASEQSQEIADRAALESRLAEVTQRYSGADVPRPPQWGGYRLMPERVEFWCHRDDRLHDRVEYIRSPGFAGWVRRRLSP